MRRGTHASYTVAALVLLAVVLLACMLIFKSVWEVYSRTEHDARCASQVRVHAAAAQATSDLKSLKVVCPSERITLEPEDDPREVIADSMKRCWDMWGRGELQLFGKEPGAYCHVCSVITVPSGEPVVGLPQYLETATVKGETYAEYLAGAKRGEAFKNEEYGSLAEASIPTEKPLGVVFYYAKGHDFFDNLQNALIGEPPRAAAVGGVAGGAAAVAAIYVASGVLSGGTFFAASGVLLAGGLATGTGAGLIASLTLREDLDSLSVVMVRPLSEEDVRLLGCTYAPVSN